MSMLQSVFGRLKLLPQNQAKDVTCNPPVGNHDEREEDGFLLIGETASDRTTVTHQQYVDQQRIHSPPDYSQAQLQQPSGYHIAVTAGSSAMNMQLSPLDVSSNNNNNHMLPLADIPFILAPHLSLLQRLDALDKQLAVATVDLSKYHYDFSLEMNYLRDMG